VKHFASEFVKSGSVLIRQRGTKIEPGTNVGRGKDDTLFALKDGVIRFERINRNKRRIAVIPAVGA
jgi:large subunit ribosomal protein L27